jgi:DNA-binding transcriptional LysR family regulator
MHQMESADANLLLALDALFQAGSVTGAARRMNVSPPAMSHTLSRLRLAVGDPLFVRAGNRLVPTPRAVAMQGRVSRAATEIGALLRPDLPLDIATLERTFIIRASDAMIVTVGHALDALVRKEAPGVALHLVGVLLAEAREVDLDIGVQYGIALDLRIQTLFHEEMVPVVRKDHPLANRRVASARLGALEHIAVASQRAKLEELTKPRRGRRWRPPSRIVPSFLAAAALVRSSDAYTVIPSRLAATIVDAFGLCRLSVTGAATKVAIAQAWSPRFDNDPGHIWLRGCVRRAFGAAA